MEMCRDMSSLAYMRATSGTGPGGQFFGEDDFKVLKVLKEETMTYVNILKRRIVDSHTRRGNVLDEGETTSKRVHHWKKL